jgi:hypothetical protein
MVTDRVQEAKLGRERRVWKPTEMMGRPAVLLQRATATPVVWPPRAMWIGEPSGRRDGEW